jgi:hypothetical protein
MVARSWVLVPYAPPMPTQSTPTLMRASRLPRRGGASAQAPAVLSGRSPDVIASVGPDTRNSSARNPSNPTYEPFGKGDSDHFAARFRNAPLPSDRAVATVGFRGHRHPCVPAVESSDPPTLASRRDSRCLRRLAHHRTTAHRQARYPHSVLSQQRCALYASTSPASVSHATGHKALSLLRKRGDLFG